ncbi:MAG: Lrp/AsnC family transcriptional regulator [Chloroflexota bacterium]|nr:Lrp/AsnC family transcriptional regulator [Chloroflexota bacterium]
MFDDLDKSIIQELGNDGRQTSKQLAKKLGVPSSTIRRRLLKLNKEDVFQVRAMTNPRLSPQSIWIMIGMNVNRRLLQTIMDALVQHPCIHYVSQCRSRYDVLAGATFESMEELDKFLADHLREIDIVRGYEILLLSQPNKYAGFRWPNNER